MRLSEGVVYIPSDSIQVSDWQCIHEHAPQINRVIKIDPMSSDDVLSGKPLLRAVYHCLISPYDVCESSETSL